MRQLKVWVAAFVMFSLLHGGLGCGVQEYVNCSDICQKKKDCGTDSNYDVNNCINVCSNNADSNSDYARQVDTCKACENGISCNDFQKQAGCLPNCPSLP